MLEIKFFWKFLGRKVINFFSELGKLFILLFSILRYFPNIFRDKKLILQQMAIIGVDSLPLVLLVGIFTGAIAALQATTLFDKFNLMDIAKTFRRFNINSSISRTNTSSYCISNYRKSWWFNGCTNWRNANYRTN